MEAALDQRIARIVDLRQRALLAQGGGADHTDRDRRAAHDQVTHEIPRLLVKISRAVAELNDRIAEARIHIALQTLDHNLAAAVLYGLRVAGADDDGPEMDIAVDYTGKITVLLSRQGNRSLIKVLNLFSVELSDIMHLLVFLVESQSFGGEHLRE